MQVIHTNKSFFKVALLVFPSLLFLLLGEAVSALTYQNSVDVEFTLNPTLSINLSSDNLVIDNLTPGSSSDSNIVTVDVATNAGYGYYMSATAGANSTDTNLTNNTNSGNVFTNLTSNVTTLSAFPDNHWGYSYSTDNGSTWISGSQGDTATGYDGLPLDNDDDGATGVILASTDSIANAGSVKFKIGAKAAITQASGTYTNIVNFYAVANPAPSEPIPPTSCLTPVPGLTYMQDLTSSNKSTILSNMTEDAEYYLADKRDDKTYCVAKLKDGNLWMTQNLDHDIVTDGSVTYDNTTTDLGWNGTSYSTASWIPSTATYDTSTTTWNDSATTPESYDPGELYWNSAAGLYSSESDCVAAGGTWDSTNNKCNQIASTGNSHYHLGNYYNWTAAVAMNDSSGYTTENTDVNQSICPSGWTLPKSGGSASGGSFQYLFMQYGWNNGEDMTNPNIWNTAIKLPLSGRWNGSLSEVGRAGLFWSPVVGTNLLNRMFGYGAQIGYNGYVASDDYLLCGNAISVRCVAR